MTDAPSLLRRVIASAATVVATAGLVAFATFGAFDNQHDPFPLSVIAR